MSAEVTPDRILQLGLGFWGPKTLLSAVELGVFTELARGPADRATLTARLGLHPRAACDFLDALVALGLLTRDGGRYANTPETDHFLDRAKPSYIGGLLEMTNDRLRFQPGDFFRDPLPPADVLVMGHILHDWDLEQKRRLIARAYAALPPGGALLVYEALIDDERRHNVFGLLMSLNMLIETPG